MNQENQENQDNFLILDMVPTNFQLPPSSENRRRASFEFNCPLIEYDTMPPPGPFCGRGRDYLDYTTDYLAQYDLYLQRAAGGGPAFLIPPDSSEAFVAFNVNAILTQSGDWMTIRRVLDTLSTLSSTPVRSETIFKLLENGKCVLIGWKDFKERLSMHTGLCELSTKVIGKLASGPFQEGEAEILEGYLEVIYQVIVGGNPGESDIRFPALLHLLYNLIRHGNLVPTKLRAAIAKAMGAHHRASRAHLRAI